MTKFDIYQMRHDMGLPTLVKNEITDIQYRISQEGDCYCLLTDKRHSLFFLLEGSIRIYSSRYGEKKVNPGHFFYVAAQSGISYQTEGEVRCVILNFNDFQDPGNSRFIEKSHETELYSSDNLQTFPIKDPLYHIVNTLLVNMSDGYDYPNIHEAILVLVRALYPPEETTIMFQQMIRRAGNKEQLAQKKKWHA